MPTLADIYSAADSFKRRLADVVQNPGLSLQQMVGYANDRARAFNELNAQTAQETMDTGQLFGPKMRELGETLASAYNPTGMTVWHGSPHVFEKFDLSKIGTGEGNQSYGRGMYVAESPEVARQYKEKLTTGEHYVNDEPLDIYKPSHFLASAYKDASGNLAETKEYLEMMATSGGSKSIKNVANEALNLFNKGEIPKVEYRKSNGAFYKVDLPDTHVRRMLDWDAPLKDQPYNVRSFAKKMGMDMNDLGGDLIAKIGKTEKGKRLLQDAGIVGIKYMDEKSRWNPYQVEILYKGKPYATSEYATRGQAEQYAKEREAEGFQTKHRMVGTRNFVVFDPNHLTILERNNQPLK